MLLLAKQCSRGLVKYTASVCGLQIVVRILLCALVRTGASCLLISFPTRKTRFLLACSEFKN